MLCGHYRAKRLYLSSSQSRMIFGQTRRNRPSRFWKKSTQTCWKRSKAPTCSASGAARATAVRRVRRWVQGCLWRRLRRPGGRRSKPRLPEQRIQPRLRPRLWSGKLRPGRNGPEPVTEAATTAQRLAEPPGRPLASGRHRSIRCPALDQRHGFGRRPGAEGGREAPLPAGRFGGPQGVWPRPGAER